MELKRPVTFHIEQLGAIKDATITLKPFMVFSGDSGLGKSYAAFLIHYLYMLLSSDRLEKFLEKEGFNIEDEIEYEKGDKDLGGFSVKSLIDWINEDAVKYIGYLVGNTYLNGKVNIEIPFSESELKFSYKEELFEIDNKQYRKIATSLNDQTCDYSLPATMRGSPPFNILLRSYINQQLFINQIGFDTTLILPPGRCTLTGLTASSQLRVTAGMYAEYLSDMEKIEEISIDVKERSNILEMIESINNGVVRRDANKLIFETEDIQIPLVSAASSVKELAPLALFVEKNFLFTSSILFEEPEAHIHPAKQIKLADLMVAIVNSGAHFQITTHSSYIVDRINDAINLYKLKQTDANKYNTFIQEKGYSEDLVLDPDKVGAYYFYKNDDGTVSVREQSLEEGIPYDSFHEVITNEMMSSMDLINLMRKIKEGDDD
ncbi:hypothetical protein Barb7_01375 [Bacteroidales bacterium Barb7]|nr:hypothetical protein Barb7_01375 [Bacteroidales bacterium Barb7]